MAEFGIEPETKGYPSCTDHAALNISGMIRPPFKQARRRRGKRWVRTHPLPHRINSELFFLKASKLPNYPFLTTIKMQAMCFYQVNIQNVCAFVAPLHPHSLPLPPPPTTIFVYRPV